jgi:hypothetical protein
MMHSRIPSFTSFVLLAAWALLMSACTSSESDHNFAFVLRSDKEVADVSVQMIAAIAAQLKESESLSKGYPAVGYVTLESDPSEPGVQRSKCVPAQELKPADTTCMLLNQGGDFLEAQPITWESEAFHMYRVHVVRKGLFVQVNPVKDYVGLDLYLLEEKDLWKVIDEAIQDAAAEIGAKPFHP